MKTKIKSRMISAILVIVMAFALSGTAAAASTTNVDSYDYTGLTFNGFDSGYATSTWLLKTHNHNHGINNVTAWSGSHTFLCRIAMQPWTNVTSDTWMTTGRAEMGYTSVNKNSYHKLWFRLNSLETGAQSIDGSWSPDDRTLDPS